jgi:hypothetical protein
MNGLHALTLLCIVLFWSSFAFSATPTDDSVHDYRPAEVSAKNLLAHAVECQGALDLHGALIYLEQARQLEPNNPEVLSLASKQWTDHTFLAGMSRADVIRVNRKALELAMSAQQADAHFSLAYSAECICKGRLACFERNPTHSLPHAKAAQEAAFRALERNELDDLAHHLIGRWNVGMVNLNFIVRPIIRAVFGANHEAATWQWAEESYSRALTLRPDRLIHKVELARVHAKTGRTDKAISLIRVCMLL